MSIQGVIVVCGHCGARTPADSQESVILLRCAGCDRFPAKHPDTLWVFP